MEEVLVNQNTGSILAGGTENPIDTTGQGGVGNTGYDWANQYNIIQSYAIENSRLHIPVIFGVDAVHGFGHPWQAPLFPHSIGIGATWDPAMASAGGAVTASATAATGWNWVFAPVQDLPRDNRWGRTYETWAEQPVLASALGAANVKGLQIPADAALAGRRRDRQTFRRIFPIDQRARPGRGAAAAELPAEHDPARLRGRHRRRRADRHGEFRAPSMRCPRTASHYLLTDILRGQMGFDGVVISDYRDVPALQTAYHVAADLQGAIAKAVNAGVDMSMQVFDAGEWQAAAIAAVESGAITQARIDEAVRRILTLKFKLGLFDQPCVRDYSKPCVDADAANAAVTAGRPAP